MTGRVRGHALRAEGAAYVYLNGRMERLQDGTGNTGYAVCQCGRTSPLLASGRQRRAWHRAHKQEWS